MRSRRPMRRVVRTSRRRKLTWARISGPISATTAAFPTLGIPGQLDLLGPFETSLGAQLIGCTVKRIRGYAVPVDALPSADLVQVRLTTHVGQQYETVPLASWSAFDPASTELDYFGFLPTVYPYQTANTSSPTLNGVGFNGGSVEFDIRSQRKLEQLNQSLFLRLSTKASVASLNVTYQVDCSVLVALP